MINVSGLSAERVFLLFLLVYHSYLPFTHCSEHILGVGWLQVGGQPVPHFLKIDPSGQSLSLIDTSAIDGESLTWGSPVVTVIKKLSSGSASVSSLIVKLKHRRSLFWENSKVAEWVAI